MKKNLLFAFIGILCLASNAYAQPNIFNPNDPLVTYNSSNPPATPPPNTLAKWVRTPRMLWNTDRFKAYYFDGMAFRLRFPNNYNPSDPNKKYPVILFFHGGGEVDQVTDNENHLFVGAQVFEQRINAGEFDGFMLYPQIRPGESWNYSYYLTVNKILDSLQKYVHTDPDRVISMGISNGGFAAVSFVADFPQRAATVISTSPALIDYVTSRINNLKYQAVWLASGGQDNNPTHETVQNFVDSFQNIGGNVRYSFFPTGGHGTWLEQWDQPFLIPYWNNAHQANPLTFFNRNKFSSEAAITARLGITGGFAQYEWQRDGVTIPGANSNEYLPKQFGSYRARFVRNGSSTWSDWSTVPAVISMDNAAPSTPGNLRVIYAARNAINLDWNDASDNESVTQYEVFVNGVKMFTTGESGITADKLASNTTYNFSVRALDLAGNTSPFSNQASATTASFANGLHYRYYEGNWNELPNFNSLTQVKSAAIANVDLELRTAGVNDFFGFVWEGYINIPTPGVYNFEIISDDGSKLYFNNVYSPSIRPLIENDGLHAPWSKAGSVNVPSAGMYPIAITFFEKYSGETMEVYWSGPNFSRQRIPNSAFVETPSDNNAPTVPNNLKVLYSGRTFVTLDWDNSTDNSAIKGYDIYVNGAKRYTSAESAITADGLDPNTAYTFTVIAQDLTGNFSGASQPVNTTTPTVASGLKYRYFEGSWDFLPNFNALTPLKTGAGPNVDLGVRTPGVNNNFALLWEGYINLPTAGTFTFELTSDDGSKLYFNSFYSPTATALVSNDGLHGAYPISASITVDKGGLYPIAITFFEKDGGEAMNVSWSGPGIPKQLIPNVAFTDPSGDGAAPSVPLNLRTLYAGRTFVNLDWDNSTDNVGVTSYDIYVDGVKKYTTNESAITANKLNASTSYIFTVKALDAAGNASASSASVAASTPANSIGLRYRYYEGSWDALPNFNALTPVKSGTTANIDLGVRTPGRNDNFGFVWEGYINIQIAGTYTFELISDDGSKLYFNSFYSPNAVPLVNLDGLHAPYPVSASVEVTSPGLYPIAMTFFELGGGETMQAYISGPGIPRQLIPDMAFAGNSIQSGAEVPGAITGNAPEQGVRKQTQFFPNPITDLLNIDFYNESAKNDITVNIHDINGKLVYNRYFGNVPAGNNLLKVNVAGSRLAPGVYFARLNINGIPSKVVKVVKTVR